MDNKKNLSVTLIYLSLFLCNNFLSGMDKNSFILDKFLEAQKYQENSPSINVASCVSSGMGSRIAQNSTKTAELPSVNNIINNNNSGEQLPKNTQQSEYFSVEEQSKTAQNTDKPSMNIIQDQEDKNQEIKSNTYAPRVMVTSNGLIVKIVGSMLFLCSCMRLCQYIKAKNNDDEEYKSKYFLILKRLKLGLRNDLVAVQYYVIKIGAYFRLQRAKAF